MSFEFLVEVKRAYPKYSSRSASNDDVVTIFPSREDDVILLGGHRDAVYNYFIKKCEELDCSGFVSDNQSSGAISLCGDCAPFIPRTPNGGGNGLPCRGYSRIQNFGSLENNQNLRVTNEGGASAAITRATDYINWKNSSTTNTAVAGSLYWISDRVVDDRGCVEGIWQCAVNCATGNTTACWKMEGPSGTIFPQFGATYSTGGQKYQIYDPLQIALAGAAPNGGTFPLVSSNPFAGTPINSQFPSLDDEGSWCGVPTTVFGGGTDTNCLVTSDPNCSCGDGEPEYEPEPMWLIFPNQVALKGDYTDKILKIGDDCYNLASVGDGSGSGNTGSGSTLETNAFGLGGSSSSNVPISTEEELGIDSTHDSCGGCISAVVQGGGGAKCCQLACNGIVINGAPNWNGSEWSEGNGSWNGFWPTHEDDDYFRDPNLDPTLPPGENPDKTPWEGPSISQPGGCGVPPKTTGSRANSIFSVPCDLNISNSCEAGQSNVTGVLELLSPIGGGPSFCDCVDLFAGGVCECQPPVLDAQGNIIAQFCGVNGPADNPTCIVDIGTDCSPPKGRQIPLYSDECVECQTQPECSPLCNLFLYTKPITDSARYRSEIIGYISHASGVGCPVGGRIQTVGCVSKASITGQGVSGLRCSNMQECASGTSTGYLPDPTLKLLIDLGLGGGESPIGGSCCYDSISSPTQSASNIKCTKDITTPGWLSRMSANCGGTC
jgi:hypothetical protein